MKQTAGRSAPVSASTKSSSSGSSPAPPNPPPPRATMFRRATGAVCAIPGSGTQLRFPASPSGLKHWHQAPLFHAPEKTGSDPNFSGSVRREVLVPVAEHLERRPELLLRRRAVEALVDVGRMEELDRRRPLLDLALRRLARNREREPDRVEERARRVAHRHHHARLGDVDLAGEPRAALLEIRVAGVHRRLDA